MVVPPLIKWPGGKRWLVPKICPHVEGCYRRYVEPFFGGGALFFALEIESALIADINPDLIGCYLAMRDDVRRVFRIVAGFPTGKKAYYKIRDEWTPRDRFTNAARFVYLLRHSWNGLYRVNRAGQFNVPFRSRAYTNGWSTEVLLEAQEKLRRTTILCADFQNVIARARKGDLVFADPPYFCDASRGFHRYNPVAFSIDDQRRLHRSLLAAESRGASWILVNADYSFVRMFRDDHEVFRVRRRQTLAAQPGSRRTVYEYVVISGADGIGALRVALRSGRRPRSAPARPSRAGGSN